MKDEFWTRSDAEVQKNIAQLRARLEEDPRNIEIYHELGMDFIQLQRNKEALELAREGFKENPNETAFRRYYADTLCLLGKNEAAVGHYRALIEGNKEVDGGLYQNMAVCLGGLEGEDNNRAARETYERGIALYPEHCVLLVSYGQFLKRKGDVEDLAKAESIFKSAVALKPEDFSTHTALFAFYRDLGRAEEAAAVVRAAGQLWSLVF